MGVLDSGAWRRWPGVTLALLVLVTGTSACGLPRRPVVFSGGGAPEVATVAVTTSATAAATPVGGLAAEPTVTGAVPDSIGLEQFPALPATDADPGGRYAVTQKYAVGRYVIREWQLKDPAVFQPGTGIVAIGTGNSPLRQIDAATVAEGEVHSLTGNGVPDLVVRVNTGGNHCCGGVVVYELGPEIKTLVETPVDSYCPAGAANMFKDLDGDGVPELITCDRSLLADGCADYWRLEAPAPTVVLRYVDGQGYVPAGDRFPTLYDEDIARAKVEIAKSPQPCAVGRLAVDYIYSGRPAEGWQALTRYLAPEDVARWRHALQEDLAASPYYVAAGATPQPVLTGAAARPDVGQ